MRDYKLDPASSGSSAAGVGRRRSCPSRAPGDELPFEMIDNADVISAIGVALALVRDTIERTVIDPTEDDIRQIREEAFQSVLRWGRPPRRSRSSSRSTPSATCSARPPRARRRFASRSCSPPRSMIRGANSSPPASARWRRPPASRRPASMGSRAWRAPARVPRLWRLFPEQSHRGARARCRPAAIRWASNHADGRPTTVAPRRPTWKRFAETYTRY
jgi:hypothetical protein